MWALLVPKNGRTVKSIYSHNLFSSFATKKWYFYHKYAPSPPETAWLQSIWGSVSKQPNFVIKNIFLYPHFCQHKLCTYLLGNSLISGRFHTILPWDEFLENFKLQTAPAPPPCPRFRKLCGAFSNEIFRIGLTPLPDSVWLRPNQTRQNLPDRPDLPSWRQQPVVAKKESCFEDIRLFAIKVRIYNVHNMISAVVLSHFPREWAFRIVSVETIVILQWTEQLNSAAKNILADLSSDFNFAATLPSVTFSRG